MLISSRMLEIHDKLHEHAAITKTYLARFCEDLIQNHIEAGLCAEINKLAATVLVVRLIPLCATYVMRICQMSARKWRNGATIIIPPRHELCEQFFFCC